MRRPLGPLRDAARGTGGPLERALDGDAMEPVFAAAVTELGRGRSTVLVVEDAHWVDDATLDVLRHVTRRIEGVPAVLTLTFRADEVGPAHPLGALLGDLGGVPVHRIRLPPLSRSAVATLARGTGRDGTALHELTAGNPFFVTEALAAPNTDAGADDVPGTVADAVVARMGQLSTAGRTALEHFEAALRHADRLDPVDRARVLDDYAWELYNANRFADAVTSAADAVRRYEVLDDRAALGEALVRLSRHHYMAGDTVRAERAVLDHPRGRAAPAGAASCIQTAIMAGVIAARCTALPPWRRFRASGADHSRM